MGLKKRSKVSAEFSMSSLTDIIFLLLIFFMLTSSLVAPNALYLKMPGTSSAKVPSTKRLDDVSISSSGKYRLNGKTYTLSSLEKELGRRARAKGSKKYNVTISPAKDAPIDNVVYVMDIMRRYHINGILAAEQ
ncbi:MAG: biopolymer transporter ExbD [Bacteroidetes bacterium]|nr:MAG: biopolymer transporter ExbD [Bacteroidota bacterium]